MSREVRTDGKKEEKAGKKVIVGGDHQLKLWQWWSACGMWSLSLGTQMANTERIEGMEKDKRRQAAAAAAAAAEGTPNFIGQANLLFSFGEGGRSILADSG